MTRTALSEREAAELLCGIYADEFGALPDPRVASFVMALLWLENAQGQSIYNYNWGNVIATSSSQMHWVPPWVRDPSHALYDGYHAGEAIPGMFRAYDSHDTGARRLWKLLVDRYRPALELAGVGEFFDAYRELVTSGYCPDAACHSDAAATNMETFADRFLRDRLFEEVCGAELPAAERLRSGEGISQAEFDAIRAQSLENVGPTLYAMEAIIAAPACAAIHTAQRGDWWLTAAAAAIPAAVLTYDAAIAKRPNVYRTLGAMGVGFGVAAIGTLIGEDMKPKAGTA
jgi:hypothetical protein